MCPHKPSLPWTHDTMLTAEGEDKTVPWMEKRLIFYLQLLEEMGQVQSGRP